MVFIGEKITRDFTLGKYKELCRTLQTNGYTPLTVRDYFNTKYADRSIPRRKIAILRHDVDRKITNAIYMAKLENDIGIHSTYYFRYPDTFQTDIIREIQDLGHEIGYHYEVLSKTKGDYKKAISLFESELQALRKVCHVDTICMHGSPLSPYDNRDLWNHYNFYQYGLMGEAYLSIGNVQYFSDTGRNWSGKNNLRDFLIANTARENVKNTDDLINFIKEPGSRFLYLTTHPERWAHSVGSFFLSYCTDSSMNFGKMILKGVRE